MKKIPLTQGQFALVDDEDFEELSKYKWCAFKETHKDHSTYYAQRGVRTTGTRKNIMVKMHREILCAKPSQKVDHKNGDGLDNRRKNIRICTQSQNMMNRGAMPNNSSGYKGVSLHKEAQKWYARITVNYKQMYLGLFNTPKDAYQSYCEACVKYHGDFARLK